MKTVALQILLRHRRLALSLLALVSVGVGLGGSGCTPDKPKGKSSNDASSPTKDAPRASSSSLPPGLLEQVRSGWMGTMASRPKAFSKLTSSSEGWNHLWGGDLERASEAFEDSLESSSPGQAFGNRVGLARALLEQGLFRMRVYEESRALTLEYLSERALRRNKIGPITPVESFYGAVCELLTRPDDAKTIASRFETLSSDPKAGEFAALATAWQGYAAQLAGDAAAADALWAAAGKKADEEPDLPLLVAYLKARAGRLDADAKLPAGDSGSVFAERLRLAALIRTGHGEEAARRLRHLSFREADHSALLKGEPAPEAKGGDDRTRLDFWGPWMLEELARLRLERAAETLKGAPGPSGCGAYWRGRALEALGESKEALESYGKVGAKDPGAGKSAYTPAEMPCLVLAPFGGVAELAEDAAARSKRLRGEALGATASSWIVRLDVQVGLAAKGSERAKSLEVIQSLPEDPRSLQAELEAGIEAGAGEAGVTALNRGRFFEHYVHALYTRKARVASAAGETRLAASVLDALHDNTKHDEFSTLNRPGYLLESALARWRNKDDQGTSVLLNVLWKRFPEVWPATEFVRRIRAEQALENLSSTAPKRGQ